MEAEVSYNLQPVHIKSKLFAQIDTQSEVLFLNVGELTLQLHYLLCCTHRRRCKCVHCPHCNSWECVFAYKSLIEGCVLGVCDV